MLHPIQPPSSFLSLLPSPTLLSFPGVAQVEPTGSQQTECSPGFLAGEAKWGSKVEKLQASWRVSRRKTSSARTLPGKAQLLLFTLGVADLDVISARCLLTLEHAFYHISALAFLTFLLNWAFCLQLAWISQEFCLPCQNLPPGLWRGSCSLRVRGDTTWWLKLWISQQRWAFWQTSTQGVLFS